MVKSVNGKFSRGLLLKADPWHGHYKATIYSIVISSESSNKYSILEYGQKSFRDLGVVVYLVLSIITIIEGKEINL